MSKKNINRNIKLKNNEIFGMIIEKSLCELYELENDINYERTNETIMNEIKPKIKKYLDDSKIILIKYIGKNANKDDFLLDNGKTIQVKSNYNSCDKVCPPKIGQCTKETFLLNIAKKINGNIVLTNDNDIKNFMFENIKKILYIYIDAYYTSDYILYIKKPKNKDYFITLYNKKIIDEKILENCKFVFTKTPEYWKESSSLGIEYNNKKYSVGEFQIHNHRNNVKFRFYRNNFHNLMEKININEKLLLTPKNKIDFKNIKIQENIIQEKNDFINMEYEKLLKEFNILLKI